MIIWKKMYEKTKNQYYPEDISPFVYTHHVVCALETAHHIFIQNGMKSDNTGRPNIGQAFSMNQYL